MKAEQQRWGRGAAAAGGLRAGVGVQQGSEEL